MNLKARFKASLFHLALSFVVISLVLSALIFLCYPLNLIETSGVYQVLTILFSVDIILGPLLTFIIFDKRKKELKRDIGFIICLQALALCYGVYNLAKARPVYVAYAIDRFVVVHANEIPENELLAAKDTSFKTSPILGPKWVSANSPQTQEERDKIIFGGTDIDKMPRLYSDINTSSAIRNERTKPLQDLLDKNPNKTKRAQKIINQFKNKSVGYVPVTGRGGDIVAIIEKPTGKVLKLVNLLPW